MARIQVNLVRNGVQYTLTDEADGIPASEFATGFAEEIDALVGSGVFQLPTAAVAGPSKTSAPAQGDTTGLNYFNAVQLRVFRAGDKVSVEFYGNEYKQPVDDFFTTKIPNWDVAKVVEMFQKVDPKWSAEHFQNGKKYNYEVRVAWKYGKTNSRGNQYKDVVGLYNVNDTPQSTDEFAEVSEPELPLDEPSDIPF